MTTNGLYGGGEKIPGISDVEYATDPASGGFFNSDYKKHDDLKQMLDVNKDSMKLEAMKRIIGMIAKGRDASGLFPSVVKNVVSKNIEVKKLVYVYLVRYAEEQQDLALLSISTFQRALKDPNQLIRGSALRVLSSIRVSMIVPIVMLAIKDASADMSPYVRKTAAHAIPKLYDLDPDQKDELISVIDKLLSDRATLVVGSAVMAFEEVCPERIDLIHKNFRKLCNVLVDVDEWGQVIIVNMLTRYARTQFIDPNFHDLEDDSDKPYNYDDESSSEAESSSSKKKSYSLDPDHKLLLRSARPLLQSRNAAVVMSVAQLYHHVAPKSDVLVIAKSLIRLLRSHREVQSVVLNSIASISVTRKEMFESYLKSFFVRTSDPTHIKILKLEILTNLATEANISIILREFQTYISSIDKLFVAATVHAIGRCASDIKEIRESCLNGLMMMLSNRDEAVVAESVVVIKKLLQTHPDSHTDIIKHMARLADSITVPQARASILWLLGEYSHLVPKLAPDVLRKMAKIFVNEEEIVKLQVLNLAVKLFLTNPVQTKLLCQYVLTLARYDQNYDIRDRSRLLRQILFPQNENSKISEKAREIFLANKPAPLLVSKFIDREAFQMGSLSHYINARAHGYQDLPGFPDTPSDPSVRNVSTEPSPKIVKKTTVSSSKKSFYSETDNSSPAEESEESDDGSEEESSDENSNALESEDSDESNQYKTKHKETAGTKKNLDKKKLVISEEETSDESNSEDSVEDSDSSDSDEDGIEVMTQKKKLTTSNKKNNYKNPNNVDLLLDLDNFGSPSSAASQDTFLSSLVPISVGFDAISSTPLQFVGPVYVSDQKWELLNKINSSGQLSVMGKFTRSPHLYSPSMVSIELTICNHSSVTLTNIRMGSKVRMVCRLSTMMSGSNPEKFVYVPRNSVSHHVVLRNHGGNIEIQEFAPIPTLASKESRTTYLGINFNDSAQAVSFEILWTCEEIPNKANVSLKVSIGELLRPVSMPESMFLDEQSKLKGMNEHSVTIPIHVKNKTQISQYVYEVANIVQIPSSDLTVLRYTAQTMSSKSFVLLTIAEKEMPNFTVVVNCEKMVVGSMILGEIKNRLSRVTAQ